MNLKSFLALVEIRTKVASILPLLIGTFYGIYKFHSFNYYNFILFTISLVFIDMSTTALNHYYDFKRAKKRHGYNYTIHNPLSNYNLDSKTAILTVVILLAIAIISGLLLFINTGYIVLLLGVLSFIIGITYSFGPIPFSRTPFGEILSGFFMGFIIFFIAAHIQIPSNQKVISILFDNYILNLNIEIIELTIIFFASLPLVLGISNIMLANNISDIKDDKKNDRYTLPIYIGKDNSLHLYKSLYLIIYIDVLILVLLNLIPLTSFLIFISIIPVFNNIKTFFKKQSKKKTFQTSIQNFLWINISYLVSYLIYFIFS